MGHGHHWARAGQQDRAAQDADFPHSLGLLYSAFTYFCGFKVNSGEYKLMGLAPYGEPKYADVILEKLMDLREDGSLRWTCATSTTRGPDHDWNEFEPCSAGRRAPRKVQSPSAKWTWPPRSRR